MDMVSKLYRSCLIILILFFVPLSASAAVDFSKLKTESFYGAYVGGNKVGYLENKSDTIENNGRTILVNSFNFYLEMGILEEQDISVFELSLTYEFDLVSGEMQNYFEKSKDIKYSSKEDLLNQNEAEVQTSTISAEYLGGSFYKVIESEENSPEEKRVSLPPLLIDNFYADVNLVQNYKVGKSEIKVDVSDLSFDEERVISAEVKLLQTHNYILENKTFKHFELEINEDDTLITAVYDANGNLIRGNIFGIELKLEPEEIAKSLDAERHISTLYSYPSTRPSH